MAGDHASKIRWEAENVCSVTIKINKNQDAELFQLLRSSASAAGTARKLLRAGLTALKETGPSESA